MNSNPFLLIVMEDKIFKELKYNFWMEVDK